MPAAGYSLSLPVKATTPAWPSACWIPLTARKTKSARQPRPIPPHRRVMPSPNHHATLLPKPPNGNGAPKRVTPGRSTSFTSATAWVMASNKTRKRQTAGYNRQQETATPMPNTGWASSTMTAGQVSGKTVLPHSCGWKKPPHKAVGANNPMLAGATIPMATTITPAAGCKKPPTRATAPRSSI